MHLIPRLKCLTLLYNIPTFSIHQLKQIHAQLITNGIKQPSLYAQLIEHYCVISSTQSIHHAHLISLHSNQPEPFLLNTLIRCLPPKESMMLFSNRISVGELSFEDFAYIFVLGACARSPSIPTILFGRQLHCRIIKCGFVSNSGVQTTTIHFYASNKDIEVARKVFDEMPVKKIPTWNAMIKGYSSQEKGEKCSLEAMLLLKAMLVDASRVKPTDTTMVCILSAASQLGIFETGACIHGYLEKIIDVSDQYDVFIGTSLVDMYSKCGCLDSALSCFNRTERKNVLTWTALLTGLAFHGKAKQALELLDAMRGNGVKPNEVTFTSLFSACCHSGLIEEGLYLFHKMESEFNVKPQMQHYGCIVDLLGRAGHLKEAYEFITRMSAPPPDAILWRSLVTACRVHGDVVMGEKVGKLLLKLETEKGYANLTCKKSEDYVALSNIYAWAERWEDVEMVREEMQFRGIENKAGYSSVQTSSRKFLDGL